MNFRLGLALLAALFIIGSSTSPALAGGACAPAVCTPPSPIVIPSGFDKYYKAQAYRMRQMCATATNPGGAGDTFLYDPRLLATFNRGKIRLDRRLRRSDLPPSPTPKDFNTRPMITSTGVHKYAGCGLG